VWLAKLRIYLLLLLLPLQFAYSAAHPFYLGVCDVVYKEDDQSLQISVRLFTNDLEVSLKKAEGKSIDLYHPADSVLLGKQLAAFLNASLKIKINGKEQPILYQGFEREGECTWLYLSSSDCSRPLKMEVQNTLLYNAFRQQAHIIQTEVGNIKKSVRLSFPESSAFFDF
jgi:hypothetical protein